MGSGMVKVRGKGEAEAEGREFDEWLTLSAIRVRISFR